MSLAILTVAVLMLVGVVLRQTLRPLRWLFIPGSVVLALIVVGRRLGKPTDGPVLRGGSPGR